MPNLTLLDVVQGLLSDTDGDSVNSISDTIEATQYANVVRSVYEDVVIEHDLLAVKQLFKLDASTDSERPTHMTVPEGYHSIEWVNYDKRAKVADPSAFLPVSYLAPQDFIVLVNSRPSNASNVKVVTDDVSSVTFRVLTDTAPTHYTLFTDEQVVFDSYNKAVDSTLQQSKTQAYGQRTRALVLEDASVIDLPPQLVTLLVNEARKFVFDVYKDGSPDDVARRAHRTRVRTQRLRHTLRSNQERTDLPDYGRPTTRR